MSNNLESIKTDIETLIEKIRVVEASTDKSDNKAMVNIYRAQGALHEAKANMMELIEQRRRDALNMEEIPFPD